MSATDKKRTAQGRDSKEQEHSVLLDNAQPFHSEKNKTIAQVVVFQDPRVSLSGTTRVSAEFKI
jgi:hypothetical protein